jgi:hypothetical protein
MPPHRHFDAPVTVYLAIDNDTRSTERVSSSKAHGGPAFDDWSAGAAGRHHRGPTGRRVAIDRGGECFAALRVVGEPPSPAAIPDGGVEPSTWGRVKLAR